MALLELFATATGAGVVTPDVLQGVAHRPLCAVITIGAVDVVMMVVIVVAVRAVHVGLSHGVVSGGRHSMIIDAVRQKRSPWHGNIDTRPHCSDIFRPRPLEKPHAGPIFLTSDAR